MDKQSIITDIEMLLGKTNLREPDRFRERVEALEFLDFGIAVLSEERRRHRPGAPESELVARAEALRHSLQEANRRLFEQTRAQIRGYRTPPDALRRLLDGYTSYRAGETGHPHHRFETLDALVAGTLLAEPIPEPTLQREAEMISYQASPASVVLELVDRASPGPEDVFYDVGSGLGQIVMLVALLTGARAKGVEFEPAYCGYARHQACALDLIPRVSFETTDARDANYCDGSVFYLFTPFTGQMLSRVLARIRDQTRRRRVVLGSYGPCTPIVAGEHWLRSVDRNVDDEFKLALFTS